MSLRSRAFSLWRNLVHRDRVDRDLDDEVRTIQALLVEEKVQQGMGQADARRAAMLQLGRVESVEERVRDARTGAFLDVLWQDVRYAVRSLRRTPGFAVAAVTTLTLGIGANITIFTLLDAVLFKPLPVPAAHELVALYENAPEGVPDAAGGTGRFFRFSYPRFERLQRALGSHGSLAAVTRSARFVVRLESAGQPTPVRGQLVSGSYFETLAIPAARGRVLGSADVRVGQVDAVAVVSDGFWKRSFGGSETAIGQTISVNGLQVTVVGVTPPGFVGIWTDAEADLWLPLTLQAPLRYENSSSSYNSGDRSRPWIGQDFIAWLNLVARVPPSEVPRVKSLLEAANRQALTEFADTFADGTNRRNMLAHTLALEPFARGFSWLRAQYSDALLALAAMVAVVLLVTCANIANLVLARAAGRAREVGIRLSLGATTGRLIRQCLTESLMLAGVGGLAGLVAGGWASGFLAHQVLGSSRVLPPVFSPDGRLMLFAAAVSVLTAILFGLAPAVRTTRIGRGASLGTNQRTAVGQSTMGGMRSLVAAQLALSVVVVFAAVLLGRTIVNFTRVDPGFDVDRLVSATFSPAASGYSQNAIHALNERLVAAMRELPGVTSAAVSVCGLVDGCFYSSGITIEGVSPGVSLQDNWVGPAYFATVGMPLVSGRGIEPRDQTGNARVAVITESVARRYFAGQDPLGKRLGFNQLDTEIVGVVRDARAKSLREPATPMVYFPMEDSRVPGNLDVRVAGDADQAVAAVREALRRTEPRLLVDSVTTMRSRLSRDVGRERLVAYLASGFACLALLLASLGLYGVLSYAVARRTQEIGVRMALGARSVEVAGLVLRDALKVVALGIVAGVAAASWATRMLHSLLFDVSASDPATGALVLAVLLAVTLAAAYLPARRAARVDPITALRSE
jgi:predicted permease